MKTFYRLLWVCIFVQWSAAVNGQTLVGPTVTGTLAPGEYYNNSGITITAPFNFTATSGQSLRLFIGSCMPASLNADGTKNFIIVNTPRVGGMLTPTDLLNRQNCELMQSIQYFDGLGRPLQSIQVKGSPSGKDIVQVTVLDQYEREKIKYLPYVAGSSDGSYKTDALLPSAGIKAFYDPSGTPATQTQLPGAIPHITTPFAVSNFDGSPLNMITEQGAPGDAWQPDAGGSNTGHTQKLDYGANDNTDITDIANTFKVMMYDVNIATDGTRSLVNAGATSYNPGTLYLSISKDENWQPADLRAGVRHEYKDKDGRVILKRIFNKKDDGSIEMLSTYYVYDAFGMLCYVLPPGALADGGTVSATRFTNYCYQYRYDERKRLIEKIIPGKGKELMVYNDLDQMVMTQTPKQRNHNDQNWTVAKYDVFGRLAVTGIFTDAGSTTGNEYRSARQTSLQSIAALWETPIATGNGYTAGSYAAYPTALSTTLAVNYYDDNTIPGLPSGYNRQTSTGVTKTNRSLATASQVKVLDGTTGTSNMLWHINYYDDLGRPAINIEQHFKGGTVSLNNYVELSATYNFDNSPASGTQKVYTDASGTASLSVQVINSYDYDAMGRKTNTWKEINGTKILLSKQVYNELGQPKEKNLHSVNNGSSFLQSIDYRYNSRGWLKSINNTSLTNDGLNNDDTNDAFGMVFSYEDQTDATLRQYNGNISGIAWQAKVPVSSGLTALTQTFEYKYDKLDRLRLANYATPNLTGRFNEAITYDVMSNITTLNRFKDNGTGALQIDQLQYNYTDNNTSNTLINVSDVSGNDEGKPSGTSPYQYNANGALEQDLKKGLFFTYNEIDLPYTVSKTGSSLTYIYDAQGTKLRKAMTGNNRDYVTGVEYDNSGALEFVATEEGRARPNGAGAPFVYDYALKDNLGNTRVLIADNGTILQQNDFYAFGLGYTRNGGTAVTPFPDNKYKYNGKEMQDDLGMNLYDYGARLYDPVLGRWTDIDPMAEAGRRHSTYNYVLNNPIRLIDPDGMMSMGSPSPGDELLQSQIKEEQKLRESPVLASTHTDNNGKVLAVFDDGDLGIYRHPSAHSKEDILASYRSNNTSAGGIYMGQTLMWNSFTEFDSPSGQATGKINFGSFEAGNWLDNFEREMRENTSAYGDEFSTVYYSLNAGGGDIYDFKTAGDRGVYRGSQISPGIYVSARDAGNFAAGAAARIFGLKKMNFMLVAGGFNLSKNNKFALFIFPGLKKWMRRAKRAGWPAYGEAEGSNFFQRLGFVEVRTPAEMKEKHNKIWDRFEGQ